MTTAFVSAMARVAVLVVALASADSAIAQTQVSVPSNDHSRAARRRRPSCCCTVAVGRTTGAVS